MSVVLKNTGVIARIIPTEDGNYVRLSPGTTSPPLDIDLTNLVVLAWMASGDLVQVKS